jgi:sulfite reductase (NADPH) flavoprotein alpha-component
VEAAAAGPESPVRAVLKASAQARATRGDENLGYLSETHGFLPTLSPLESLSRGFSPWDDVARELPRLYRDVRVRRAIDALPELDARELSDAELLRASALLSTLAHAYWYSEVTPPQGLPRTLEVPWAEVRARLGRGPAVMSYVDLIVSNWRLKDRTLSDPLRVENMMLLFPTVGTREEQVFYLTQAEILGRCSPIVGATARAQEAVLAGDDEALEAALLVVLGCLQRVLRDSLLKINPHPDGDRSKIVRRSSQASEPEIRQKGI